MKEHYLKPVSPPPVEESVEKIKDSIPKPELKEEKGKEGLYAVDYFKFEAWGDLLLNEALDVNGIKDKVLFIEDFIESQIKGNNLKPGKDSFVAILKEMENSLKLSGFHDPGVRIQKVYKYLKVMEKSTSEKRKVKEMIMKANREAERNKKDFLNRFGVV